jgi:hypothetical protein
MKNNAGNHQNFWTKDNEFNEALNSLLKIKN